MGSVFGVVGEEQPNFDVLHAGVGYEVRRYNAHVEVETHGPADEAFRRLARYIGVFGSPQNSQSTGSGAQQIAMTAPVVTDNSKAEKIAMTAPVVTSTDSKSAGPSDMRMAFVLPSKFTIDSAPTPTEAGVKLRQVPAHTVAALRFSGLWKMHNVQPKVKELRELLEADGVEFDREEWSMQRYNPPWTLPFLRTNEVLIPVQGFQDK